MATVLYNQGGSQFIVQLTALEQTAVARLFVNSQTGPISALLTDWLRIRYAEIVSSDKTMIINRLDTATAADLSSVKVALNLVDDTVVSITPSPKVG